MDVLKAMWGKETINWIRIFPISAKVVKGPDALFLNVGVLQKTFLLYHATLVSYWHGSNWQKCQFLIYQQNTGKCAYDMEMELPKNCPIDFIHIGRVPSIVWKYAGFPLILCLVKPLMVQPDMIPQYAPFSPTFLSLELSRRSRKLNIPPSSTSAFSSNRGPQVSTAIMA